MLLRTPCRTACCWWNWIAKNQDITIWEYRTIKTVQCAPFTYLRWGHSVPENVENYVIYQHLSLMESAAAVVSRDLHTSITTWKIMEDKADKRTIYPSHRPRLLYESPVPSRAAMSGGSDRAPISLANCLYYVRHRLVSGRPRRLPHQPRWLCTDNLICGYLMRQRWELSRPVRGGIHQVSGWKMRSQAVVLCVVWWQDLTRVGCFYGHET